MSTGKGAVNLDKDIRLGRIRSKHLFEQVLEELADLIRAGKLAPGDRLPSERELTEMLGISRPSLREALRVLSMLGVIESRPREGTVIREARLDQAFRSLGVFLMFDPPSLTDFYELRSLLECGTVSRAAVRATAEDIENLDRWCRVFEYPAEKEELAEADFFFHAAVAQATHNQFLVKVWEFSSGVIAEGIHRVQEVIFSDPRTSNAVAAQHRAIFKAIKDRDPEGASAAMSAHLQWATEQLERIQEQTSADQHQTAMGKLGGRV